MRELDRNRDWEDWTSQNLSPACHFCFLEYISSESSSYPVLEVWDWDNEWEGFHLSSETATSIVVLGLLSSTETEIQVLSFQVSIAVGLKKEKKKESEKGKNPSTELLVWEQSLKPNKLRSCPVVQCIVAKSSPKIPNFKKISFSLFPPNFSFLMFIVYFH